MKSKQEWKKTTLGELVTFQRGHDLPKNQRIMGNFPLVSSSGIVDSHNEYKAKGPGVVIGRSGSLGSVYYVENDYWPLNTTLYSKQIYNCNPKFIYYLVKTLDLQNYNAGTSVPTLNRNHIHPLEMSVPSIDEQGSITKYLSDLENKIQNLQNQNKILEQMAQAIFKSWFIDFDGVTEFEDSELGQIPTGWSTSTLETFVDYLVGFPFKSKEFHEGKNGIKLARGDNVKEQELVWGSKTRLWKNVTSNLEKFLVKQNDVLIGMDGSKVGYNFTVVYDYDLPLLLVQRVARLRPKVNYYDEFVWQLIKNGIFTNYILTIKTGSTIPHISKEQILNFSVISPPENILKKFFRVTESIRKRISKNKNQVNYLIKTRDALLPKLMSGEIRV